LEDFIKTLKHLKTQHGFERKGTDDALGRIGRFGPSGRRPAAHQRQSSSRSSSTRSRRTRPRSPSRGSRPRTAAGPTTQIGASSDGSKAAGSFSAPSSGQAGFSGAEVGRFPYTNTFSTADAHTAAEPVHVVELQASGGHGSTAAVTARQPGVAAAAVTTGHFAGHNAARPSAGPASAAAVSAAGRTGVGFLLWGATESRNMIRLSR
jgi:hypothetical protein